MRTLGFRAELLAEQIVPVLTESILDGTLSEGEQLVEAELQRCFGISRSPIREAFRDLERRGLVVLKPRKGAFVRTVTRKDLEQTIPVRAALEGLAAREAFLRINKAQLDRARTLFTEMSKAARKNQRSYWSNHNDFHEVFIAASQNDILIDILKPLRTKTMWYRFSVSRQIENLTDMLPDHEKLLVLFSSKNSTPEEIQKFVSNHVQHNLTKFLDLLPVTNGT